MDDFSQARGSLGYEGRVGKMHWMTGKSNFMKENWWGWATGLYTDDVVDISPTHVFLDHNQSFQHNSLEMYQDWLAWKTARCYG